MGRGMKPESPSSMLCMAAAALIAAGIGLGLTATLGPGRDGDALRIAIIHYPASALGLGLYLAIGALAVATLSGHGRTSAMVAEALAPTGLVFTGLALWTEALWCRAVDGDWWDWSGHGISLLALLVCYVAVLAPKAVLADPRRADDAAALLALLGAANLVALAVALRLGNALPDADSPSLGQAGAGLIAATALVALGFACYAAHVAVRRMRCAVAEGQAASRSERSAMEKGA